jgi:NAD(P)-dependent dehydrogenase (short-subunit alcohol dehydrogenase family)
MRDNKTKVRGVPGARFDVALSRGVTGLDGRVAIVTGAAQGLGAAAAVGLAEFGADVVVCDRKPEGLEVTAAEVRRRGRRARVEVLDVRDLDALPGFVGRSIDELSSLDILVNNAGGSFHAPFLDVSAKGEAMLIDENFRSVAALTRACVPHLRPGGSIVNVTSIEAHRASPGFAVYAAMKAAVAQLTQSLALELAARRIRVNAIAPDAIPTPGGEPAAAALGNSGHANYEQKVPLGLGHPDDFAAVVVFLAGDLARFVTGTTIHCDGGASAASGWTRTEDGAYIP